MNLIDFIPQLEKTHRLNDGFEYLLGNKLTLADLEIIETNLSLQIPAKVKDFYLIANGLQTQNPHTKIIEIHSWKLDSSFIHFATFDNSIKILFDTSHLNQAGEWTILSEKDNYEITLSISSFWSNKIWHWIKQKKKIWEN